MRFLVKIAVIVWIGCFGWLFWAHEINEEQPWQIELGALVVLLLLSWFLKRAFMGNPAGKGDRSGTPAAEDGLDAILAEQELNTGDAERATALPGWALVLRSPWRDQARSTSWIGGMPRVPAGFDWPRGDDGRPYGFVMQIDLSKLDAESTTGQTAPGLPQKGQALVFIGQRGYAVRLLAETDMDGAREMELPDEGAVLGDLGFFNAVNAFPRWDVDPVAYLDTDGARPDCFPDTLIAPEDWLDTWALAGFEANRLVKIIDLTMQHAVSFFDLQRGRALADMPQHKQDEAAHFQLVLDEGSAMRDEIAAFAARAQSMPEEDAPDAEALRGLFAKRRALATRIQDCNSRSSGTFSIVRDLVPSPAVLFDAVIEAVPGLRGASGDDPVFADVPPGYRSFLEAMITDWRGHRLFGLQQPPPFNYEDLRGQDCLFSISADRLFLNETEHFHGYSVWCPRADMADGRYDTGQILWHSNG